MKNLIVIFYSISIVFVFYSCSSTSTEEVKAASIKADSLLEAIKTKKNNLIPTFYTKDFYSQITKEQWNEDLDKMNSLYGKMQTYTLTNIDVQNNVFGNNYILLEYTVKYATKETIQKLTLTKEGSEFKVMGHNIKIP